MKDDNKELSKIEKNTENAGKAIGATVGGALGVAMSNPLGKFFVLSAQDQVGLNIYKTVAGLLSDKAGTLAFNVYSFISNAIIAYPAILPIAGGAIVAGIGALVGKKITRARLKHKSLAVANNTKYYSK